MNFKKFMKNSKAISPIFATLILIAIAVIAGVVVYMFTSGTLATMTGGGTAAQEKLSIQAVQTNYVSPNTKWTDGTSQIVVYAQSQSGTVAISNAILKNSAGNVVGAVSLVPSANAVGQATASTTQVLTSLTAMTLTPYTGTFTTGLIPAGANTYTLTLVSSKGGNFVSAAFTIIG